jgi:hypothetical protein
LEFEHFFSRWRDVEVQPASVLEVSNLWLLISIRLDPTRPTITQVAVVDGDHQVAVLSIA